MELEALSWLLPEVQSLTDRLWMMSLERRQALAGLPADRADVILFGAAIYEAVMMRCGFTSCVPLCAACGMARCSVKACRSYSSAT